MKSMLCLLGLICCLSLTTADAPRLRQLQEKGRFFELREALQEAGWDNPENLFYRGLVESRFGQEPAAVVDLQKFLAASSDQGPQRKAYEEMASALVRLGRYGD